MAGRIDGRALELLHEPNFCTVATLDPSGAVDAAVVWVDVDGDDLVLNTAEGRRWPANLARDGRVTLTIPNRENQYEYVAIKGRVTQFTTDGADDHIDRMAQKYIGQDTYPYRAAGEVRTIVRIAPDHVHYRGA